MGGPDAIAGIGDWALSNGLLCAAISDPSHESVLSTQGGVLVDLGHCARGDDHFIALHPLFGLARENVPPVSEVVAEVADGEARVRTAGVHGGLRFETVYRLDETRPRALRVVTRVERTAPGAWLGLFGDVVLHGVASLAAFTADTREPQRSRGFQHPDADPDRRLSMFLGIVDADLQILVGGEVPAPGIAYGLRLEAARFEGNGRHAAVPLLGLNGADFSILATFAKPPWLGGSRVGWLELLQLPFLDLAVGEALVVERAVLVGERADAASVLDQVLADAPVVRGRVDDAAARLHVAAAGGAPLSHVRPEPDGRFAFRAPAGATLLVARTPDGREARRALALGAAGLDVGVLELGAPARIALPALGAMRLVFLGEAGTPDPVFGDDGVDLRFGALAHPASREANHLALSGRPSDPSVVVVRPGRYRVLATRGPEHDVREARVEARAGQTVALAIAAPQRAVPTPGWIAADLHVHAEPSDDSTLPLREQLAAFVAEGAEVLVATDHDRITDYGPAIRELELASQVAALAGSEITTTFRGGEVPHTSGHYNAFPLRPEPGAFQEGVPPHEGRRLRRVIADLRSRGALLQLNHARTTSRGDGGLFDHLAVAGTGFDPSRALADAPNRALLEPDPASGFRDLDFDAMELVNGPSLESYRRLRADWLSLLLQGERRTATANSDSHRAREVIALARNYVRVPDDRPGNFDAREFVDALRAGRSYGTTGPILELDLGGAGPGDRFAGRAGELRVRVLAAAWVPVSRARVYVNAVVAEERPTRAGDELRLPLAFERDSFVVVEVWGEPGDAYAALAPGFTPLAFSNPIWVDADADGAWRAPGLRAPLPLALTHPGDL